MPPMNGFTHGGKREKRGAPPPPPAPEPAPVKAKRIKQAAPLPPVPEPVKAKPVKAKPAMSLRMLSFSELRALKGIKWSRVHLWRLERDALFPRRVHLGRQTIAWPEDEVDAFLQEKLSQRGSLSPATFGSDGKSRAAA